MYYNIVLNFDLGYCNHIINIYNIKYIIEINGGTLYEK